jgi:cardiolipin synthase
MAGHRVVTVPNLITVARLACLPLFLWLLFRSEDLLGAFAVLAALGATDWVDGWVARRFDQGSDLGKVLDPVADRVLLLSTGVALLVQGSVPEWFGIAILVRESVIAIATLVLAIAGARRIDVQWVGKAGTFLAMFAFPTFLLADAVDGTLHDIFLAIAYLLAVPAVILSYYAAITYWPIARRALADGRADRTARLDVRTAA